MHLRKLIPAVLLSVGLVTAGLPAQQQTVDAEIVIARSVDDREPVGAGEEFPSNVGQRAGWTRVTGPANSIIEHVWRHQGKENVIPLSIGNECALAYVEPEDHFVRLDGSMDVRSTGR